MKLHGKNIIGDKLSALGSTKFSAYNPANGAQLETEFTNASPEETESALVKADEAFEAFQNVTRSRRANFLNKIGEEIVALGDDLINTAVSETGLPESRIIGERGRTVGQLNLFADLVREGDFLEISLDTAQPERTPLPKPDIRMINIPIGPVAVFGASNFPLAFSVAGGDTASAFAAGCPVIVKAHPAHPGTCELVGTAIKKAAEATGMPEGIFSLLHGNSTEVGETLVKNPFTKAVAFTGSFHGGKALFDVVAAREEPIPCFAEMGSINPVFLLPERLEKNASAIADHFVDSVNLGVGQFCTNPGIVFGLKSTSLDEFVKVASEKLGTGTGGTMLHKGIKTNYDLSVKQTRDEENVALIASGHGEGETTAVSHLLKASGSTFIRNKNLQKEMFGPSSLIVECDNEEQLILAARSLNGNLTATLQATEKDLTEFKALLKILEQKVGRILVNGFPTGVEVCHSMVHGGPYPATTDSRFTSVGAAAVKRFLRPVCYQNFPQSALKEELRDDYSEGLRKKIDGKYTL